MKIEQASHAPARMGARRSKGLRVSSSLGEINVVPLIDVMLVLLVIFMVTAPMMTQGFQIHLPEVRRAPPTSSEALTVTVPVSFRQDQKVFLGKEAISVDVLAERVKQSLVGRANQDVLLAADGAVTVQEEISVFARLMDGGVTRVGIQVQPPTPKGGGRP
jgi:biopolymer transport protein TolR